MSMPALTRAELHALDNFLGCMLREREHTKRADGTWSECWPETQTLEDLHAKVHGHVRALLIAETPPAR